LGERNFMGPLIPQSERGVIYSIANVEHGFFRVWLREPQGENPVGDWSCELEGYFNQFRIDVGTVENVVRDFLGPETNWFNGWGYRGECRDDEETLLIFAGSGDAIETGYRDNAFVFGAQYISPSSCRDVLERSQSTNAGGDN